uniref:Ionotropic glutamate receptor C-terminal domain-containing protein n=1 Tax=Anopheles farauti TaxID=69004 RepID=A0A182QQZ8_9DIPT
MAENIPLFRNASINVYIRYTKQGFEERSYRILLLISLPVSLMGVVLCLSLHLAVRVTNWRKANKFPPPTLTAADSFVWLVGVIAQQGSSVRPTSTSGMIIILVALCFSTVIYCTYLTKIAAQLSVDVETHSNLETLLAEKQYRIGFVGNNISNQTSIRLPYDPNMYEVMRRMQHDTSLYAFSYEEGLRRVLTSKYAMIGDAGSLPGGLFGAIAKPSETVFGSILPSQE